jgi:glutaminyl-tRNA synthetase
LLDFRPIEESLREFENMRKGKYDANAATLRMKMDMLSPNPNMWDQVAYRIKYMPHPHAGDTWCIYPTYDYTHCIIDSLEHIDYSICTLEFETRRESYYWVLEALDLYRPKVYEMSRLNISYTVLSKRKLLKLVMNGYMRGWDDPRMPTIKGLRRRGYTATIMNSFCREIGVTRNANTVQYERLAAVARTILHESAPRVMAVLHPVKVILTNFDEVTGVLNTNLTVPNFPFDSSRGSHSVPLEAIVYVDRADVRLVDSEDFYGLAPQKIVGLKYAYRIFVDTVEGDATTGAVSTVYARLLREEDYSGEKPKTAVQWVPATSAVAIEARLYSHLFLLEEPHDETWEAELNPTSEVVVKTALADPSIIATIFGSHDHIVQESKEKHVQFERVGFFFLDRDSVIDSITPANSKLVFNLTVNLKDSKPKDETAVSNATGAGRSRKEEQMKALAEKHARMNIRAEEFFRSQTNLYSAFDEDGVPTHDMAGEKLSKSAWKKLRKEWEKQKQLYESAHLAEKASASDAAATANDQTDIF